MLMRKLHRSLRVSLEALAFALSSSALLHAQDNAGTGEPTIALDPATLTYDLLVDGNLPADDPANGRFQTLQAAYAAAPEGTEANPTVIGIAPNVYVIPGPIAGTSLQITKNFLTLL